MSMSIRGIKKWHRRVWRIAVNKKVGENMKEKEHQSIEWKESWQDEYLKWICGYANAYGGTIYMYR